MVHALRESCRVLGAEGILIDLRPVSALFPIDAVAGSSEFRIGEGNATATIEDDRAADRAILEQVDGSWLVPRQHTKFEIDYYWDTTSEMAEFLRTGRVPKTVTPDYAEIDAALRAAGNRADTPARLRSTRRMTLYSFAKGRRGAGL
jgi:hypothetical protein